MGTLVLISGVIVALYTAYSALGLWMAQHIIAVENGDDPMRDDDGLTIIDHLPIAHLNLIKHYYVGIRGIIWRISFVCLLASVAALVMNSQFAVYLFGLALAVDCALFLTYQNREEFLAEADLVELLFDAAQYAVLLGAFLLLAWRYTTSH